MKKEYKPKTVNQIIREARRRRGFIDDPYKDFTDKYNPLNFYCSLRDMGIRKIDAKNLAEFYELIVYRQVMDIVKGLEKKTNG